MRRLVSYVCSIAIMLAIQVTLCGQQRYIAPNCADGQCQRGPVASVLSMPFDIVQSKADAQARVGRVFHTGSIIGGNFEGVGSGSTPEQALANCCRPRSGTVVSQAVSLGRNGQYFATRVYQSTASSVRRVGRRLFRR
jgi:hypothetical protein